MIISINDIEPLKNEYFTEVLKKCQIKLHEYELKNQTKYSEHVILILHPLVEIPEPVKNFTIFDSHCFKNGISFKNLFVALSSIEILATPSVRTDLSQVINRSGNLFNDIDEHFYITKQLFLSCGIMLNTSNRIS